MATTMTIEHIGGSYYRAYDTGAAALAETLAPNTAFELIEVRIHLSGVGVAGSLTVTSDSSLGSAYDVVNYSVDLSGDADICYTFGHKEKMFAAGDELDFAWANSGEVTWGLEVIYKLI